MKRRSGFTLIELMVVIVIIIILISILTPVLAGVVREARISKVQHEIQTLEYAIADFNAHFNMAPPSYIDFRVYQRNVDGTYTLDTNGNSLHPSTSAKLRRMFPNIDEPIVVSDLKTKPENQRELDGSACLVFFLGGVTIDVNGIPMGFSKNPRTPLRVTATSPRVGPFYEFDQTRLIDNDPTPFNGYEGYRDPLSDIQLPYQYTTRDQYAKAVSDGKAVYRLTASQFAKPNSFQIISPGYDNAFGVGGVYDAKKESITNGTLDTSKDIDNITNFGNGPLVD